MKRFSAILIVLNLMAPPLICQEREQDRLLESATVPGEILEIPDDVPQDWLNQAECVIASPSVKKFVIFIGGTYGRGAVFCRSGKDFTEPWTEPAMFAVEGGSFGFCH